MNNISLDSLDSLSESLLYKSKSDRIKFWASQHLWTSSKHGNIKGAVIDYLNGHLKYGLNINRMSQAQIKSEFTKAAALNKK